MSRIFPIGRFTGRSPYTTTNFDNIFNTLFNDPFPSSSRTMVNVASTPRANVVKIDEGYSIELAAPGFSRDEFDISVDSGVLSVSVSTSDTADYAEKLTTQEFSYSSFTRSWNLPENASVENIDARYEAGILSVIIPVTGKSETKRIIDVK